MNLISFLTNTSSFRKFRSLLYRHWKKNSMESLPYSTSYPGSLPTHVHTMICRIQWVLPESVDLPDISPSMEIYNYCGKLKSLILQNPIYNFQTMAFRFFQHIGISEQSKLFVQRPVFAAISDALLTLQ